MAWKPRVKSNPKPTGASGAIRSSLTAVPKTLLSQWCIFMNLASLMNASANYNLKRELAHVAYSSVDATTSLLHHLYRKRAPYWPKSMSKMHIA